MLVTKTEKDAFVKRNQKYTMPHPISLEQQLSTLSVSSDAGQNIPPVTSSVVVEDEKNKDSYVVIEKIDGAGAPTITTTAETVPTSSVLVTPTKSVASSTVDSSFEDDQDEAQDAADVQSKSSSTTVVKLLAKTEHKIMEEQGYMDNEPLLKENPHRFVIFPIQDNDVSDAWKCITFSAF